MSLSEWLNFKDWKTLEHIEKLDKEIKYCPKCHWNIKDCKCNSKDGK